MQKSIYHYLFFICLLFSPIGSDANIDSQNAPPAALMNPVLAKNQRHFPTANPLDRLKMPKKMRGFIEKRLQKRFSQFSGGQLMPYTEGSPKPETKKRNPLWGRIFTVLLLIMAGALLVYWLQGTIGLLIATLGITSFWRNRDRIADWERRRQERIYAYESAPRGTDANGRGSDSLNHISNKFTRRSITRFLLGIGLSFLGFILVLLTLFANIATAAAIFITLLVLVGYIFSLVGIINGIQAISAKEPQSAWAWLVVIFGIPVVLSLLGILFAIAAA
jgi:uncharacterized membrane protein HdeD (DUF308 family)